VNVNADTLNANALLFSDEVQRLPCRSLLQPGLPVGRLEIASTDLPKHDSTSAKTSGAKLSLGILLSRR